MMAMKIMTYKCSLLKKCVFEIRKVFKNTQRLILNTESMLLSSNTKNVLFFKYKKYVFKTPKMCDF